MRDLPGEATVGERLSPVELYRVVLEARYHEDNLLQSRTYNFATINAFLAAAFAVAITQAQGVPFHYLTGLAGFGMALFQAWLGLRNDRALRFWDKYLNGCESKLGVRVRRAHLDFYREGLAVTPFCAIEGDPTVPAPTAYNVFPWSLHESARSTILWVAVGLPWAVALFWYAALSMLLVAKNGALDLDRLILVAPSLVLWTVLTCVFLLFSWGLWFGAPQKPVGSADSSP